MLSRRDDGWLVLGNVEPNQPSYKYADNTANVDKNDAWLMVQSTTQCNENEAELQRITSDGKYSGTGVLLRWVWRGVYSQMRVTCYSHLRVNVSIWVCWRSCTIAILCVVWSALYAWTWRSCRLVDRWVLLKLPWGMRGVIGHYRPQKFWPLRTHDRARFRRQLDVNCTRPKN